MPGANFKGEEREKKKVVGALLSLEGDNKMIETLS
jgi:hypothetical protein